MDTFPISEMLIQVFVWMYKNIHEIFGDKDMAINFTQDES